MICLQIIIFLNFKDIIEMEQPKLVFDFKNNNLPIELADLFTLNSDMHSHFTRNVAFQF